MSPDEKWKLANFGFLYDATATLLGYFVRTWYGHYLDVITKNLQRWHERGLIANMIEPTEEGAYFPMFDMNALDMEKIVYVNGIYLYILMSHKEASWKWSEHLSALQTGQRAAGLVLRVHQERRS